MGAVSREHVFRLDVAAEIATAAYMPVTAEDLNPTYDMRMFMPLQWIRWLAAPPTGKECKMSRLPFMTAARKYVSTFKDVHARGSARLLFISDLWDAR